MYVASSRHSFLPVEYVLNKATIHTGGVEYVLSKATVHTGVEYVLSKATVHTGVEYVLRKATVHTGVELQGFCQVCNACINRAT